MKLRCLIKLVHRQEIRFQQLKFFALEHRGFENNKERKKFQTCLKLVSYCNQSEKCLSKSDEQFEEQNC